MLSLFFLIFAFLLAGCGGGTPPQPPVEPAVLAAADRADGHTDQVVHRCAVCALGMDGSPSYTVQHAGYTFHFCSLHCQQTFEHDPEAVLRRLPPAR